METMTFSTSIRAGGGSVVGESAVYQSDELVEINNQVGAGLTVTEAVAVDVSALEAFYMFADVEVTVTPKASGIATSDGPFTIPAKRAIWWNTGRVEASPFTDDFDTLAVHNADPAVANIKLAFLIHAVA